MLQFLPFAISGLSALAGALGGRKQKAETSSTMNSTENSSNTSTSTPTLSPEALQALQVLMPNLINRVNSSNDISGYEATGLRNINQAGDSARQRLMAAFAQRGLGNSPAAAAMIARQGDSQAAETLNFQNSLPLLQRQMQGEDLTNLMKMFSAIPTGVTQTANSTVNRTGTSTGTQTTPGNMFGGAVGGLGEGLASTFGYQWALRNRKKELGY